MGFKITAVPYIERAIKPQKHLIQRKFKALPQKKVFRLKTLLQLEVLEPIASSAIVRCLIVQGTKSPMVKLFYDDGTSQSL